MSFMSQSINNKKLIKTAILSTICMVFFGGCKTADNYGYEPPEPQVPDRWTNEIASQFERSRGSVNCWWNSFEDPYLSELIEKGLDYNYNIRTALSRVKQARIARAITAGERKLDINASGYYSRSRASDNSIQSIPATQGRHYDMHSVGVDASWEIDVFGRIERAVAASDADYQATVEDLYDIESVLTSEIASTYIYIRTLQQRLQYAKENVRTQSETLELTQERFDAQLVPRIDVEQAKLNLARTESIIPQLEMQITQSFYTLRTLLGADSSSLVDKVKDSGKLPRPSGFADISMPADAVRRRPDVRRSERALYAQTLRIGVAQRELYPQFSLSGSFAFEGTQLKHLGNDDSRAWSWGPSFYWPLFNGDRLRNNILLEKERTEELLLEYKYAVLNALEEVENSLTAYDKQKQRRAILARSVNAAKKSVELVTDLYKSGLTDFQNVLDTQQSLFQQQDELASTSGDVLQSLIDLYKATGGGWTPLDIEEKEQDNGYCETDPVPEAGQ